MEVMGANKEESFCGGGVGKPIGGEDCVDVRI